MTSQPSESTNTSPALREDGAPNDPIFLADDFQERLKALHEINLLLSHTYEEQEMLRIAIQQGRRNLGFDRLGLFLYEPEAHALRGTFGTDANGQSTDESQFVFAVDSDAPMKSVIDSRSRVQAFLDVDLQEAGRIVGRGWNILASLWYDDRLLGTLSADNLTSGAPLKPHQLELLSLFASTLAVHIERSRIQFQLVQERTLLRNTIDSIPDLIYFKDLTGTFVGANAAFARFYGKPLEQIIGRGSAAIDPPELVTRIQDEDRKVMETGEIMRLDLMIKAGDGAPAPMVLVKSPLYSDKQEVIGLIGVAHDVSEFKRIEGALRIAKDTAEQATMAKSQFLANMSHEIRTPMNAIIGMSTLLGSTALSAEQQEYVDTIRSSGDSLLQLIDEILDYSKIEAGRMHVDPRAFDIHQLMRDTLHMFTAAARQRYNQMELIVGPTVPATIVTDDKRLRQILVNLIGNAVKFTERGLIRVLVAGGVTNDLVELHFAVQDSGIGIPPDRVSRLFESFYQVDSTSARRYSGTGLGLAISKRLADLLGGKMWVESTLGRGSTFHFTVQATLAGSQQEVVRKAAITLPPRPSDQISKLRMLLVEDNAVNQRVAVRILERLGYRTDVAVNGREAVEQVRAKDFDVILMDVQMPEMDGLEATRRIRSMFPPGVPQPNIVALTADATSGDRERCLLAGMDEYLSKPLRVDELAAILARYEQRLTVAKK